MFCQTALPPLQGNRTFRALCPPALVRYEQRAKAAALRASRIQDNIPPDAAQLLMQQLQPDQKAYRLDLGWGLSATDERIRGVQATALCEPGATMLSIPAPLVLTDAEHDKTTDIPWSGYLAVRLLQICKASRIQKEEQDDLSCTWVQALPKQVSHT